MQHEILVLQNKEASTELAKVLGSKYEVRIENELDRAVNTVGKGRIGLCFVYLDYEGADIVDCVQTIRQHLGYDKGGVVVLSSSGDGFAATVVLDAGADEFWELPMSKRLLKARVGAIFRRFSTESRPVLRVNNCVSLKIDKEKYTIQYGGVERCLSKKEFELIEMFAEFPKKVFTRQSIKEELWTDRDLVNERTIDVHIKNLREKIGSDLIRTVKGVGYKLDCV